MTVLLIRLLQPLPGGVVLVLGGTVLAIDVTAVLVSAVGLDPLLHPVLPPVHLTSSPLPSINIIVLVLHHSNICHVG